jgi:acetamidase/formamidase
MRDRATEKSTLPPWRLSSPALQVHRPQERAPGLAPRGTPANYISMGFDNDLTAAAKLALHNMLLFLTEEKHMNRDDAYMFTSVACDMDVTEVVDQTSGVHVLCPKAPLANQK